MLNTTSVHGNHTSVLLVQSAGVTDNDVSAQCVRLASPFASGIIVWKLQNQPTGSAHYSLCWVFFSLQAPATSSAIIGRPSSAWWKNRRVITKANRHHPWGSEQHGSFEIQVSHSVVFELALVGKSFYKLRNCGLVFLGKMGQSRCKNVHEQ